MSQLGEPPQGGTQAPGSAVLRGFNEQGYVHVMDTSHQGDFMSTKAFCSLLVSILDRRPFKCITTLEILRASGLNYKDTKNILLFKIPISSNK